MDIKKLFGKKSISPPSQNTTQASSGSTLDEFSSAIVSTVREPLIVLNTNMVVQLANDSFYTIFNVNPSETIGKSLYNLGNGQWNIPDLKKLLEEILPLNNPVTNFQVEHNFPHIGHKVMLLNAREIKPTVGGGRTILLAIEDVTDQVKRDNKLKKEYADLSEDYSEKVSEIAKSGQLVTESEKTIQTNEKTIELQIQLLESVQQAIIATDMTGNIMYWNMYAEKLYGWKREEVLGKPITEITPSSENKDEAVQIITQLQAGKSWSGEFTVKKKDGTSFIGHVIDSPIHDSKGNMIGIVGFSYDITSTKDAEEILLKSEKKFRDLFERMSQGVVYQDRDGKITFANPAAQEILGLTFDQMQGKTSLDPEWKAIHEDGTAYPGNEHPAMVALKTGTEVRDVIMGVYHSKEKSYRWIRISAIPEFEERVNMPFQVVSTFSDITKLKMLNNEIENEKNLLSSEKNKLTAILKNIGDALIVSDSQGRVKMINSVALKLLQVTEAEVIDDYLVNVFDLLQNGKIIPHEKRPINSLTSNNIHIQTYPIMRKNKTIFYGILSVTPLVENNVKTGSIEVIHDVTQERKQMLELQKFKLAVEKVSEQIVISDPEGIVIYANPTTEVFTGYQVSEAMGKKAGALWGGRMDKTYYENMWRTIKTEKKSFSGVLKNVKKNGEEYLTEVIISPILDENNNIMFFVSIERDVTEKERMEQRIIAINKRFDFAKKSAGIGVWEWDVLKNKLIWDDQMYELYGVKKEDFSGAYDAWQKGLHPDDRVAGEEATKKALSGEKDFDTKFRVVWPDGSIHYIRAFAVIEKDTNGKAIKMIGINFDVTREEEIDKAKTEFISLASHQLRTPLSTINWYCELLLAGDAGPINDEQKKFVAEAYGGSQRMVRLVNALLNVSRIETNTYMIEPEEVDLVRLIRSVFDEYKLKIDERKLTVKLEKDEIPTIMLDSNLTTMIFQNLLSNAIKYTPEGGSITIYIHIVKKGEQIGKTILSVDSLLITVKDSGIGIPPKEKNEIFKKLYRAENVRKMDTEGTGLGLYLIKSFIDHNKGNIWFESEEGKGTTFYVLLPLTGMVKKEGNKRLNE